MAKAAKRNNIKFELPKGYKAIEGGGNAWRTEKKGDFIEGKMLKVKAVHMPKQGKQKARDVNLYTIETKNGPVSIFQSAGLKALESVKKGQSVFIQYVGKKLIKKGQNPMREYIVATK